MKTQEKIQVASNSNRGNGDNFTAVSEMGKPFAKASKICIQSENVVHCFCHNSKTLIFRNPLLKEICFSFQRNILHEIKRIFCMKDLGEVNIITLVILKG